MREVKVFNANLEAMAAQDTNARVRILRSDAEFATVAGANCGTDSETIPR